MRALLIGVCCLLNTSVEAQINLKSANYLLPACKNLISGVTNVTTGQAFDQGICVGTLHTLHTLLLNWSLRDIRACIPREATLEQTAQVAVTYIEARPQRMHEDFILLALEALASAWPCNQAR